MSAERPTSPTSPGNAGETLPAVAAEALRRLAGTPLPAAEASSFGPGEVWLAGAGPGSLECLTLGVVAALAKADAVVYDALVNPDLLLAAPKAEKHYVGKRAGVRSAAQADINALLIRLAGEGKRVLRLKGGDPNVFGRGGEEARVLAGAGVPFRFLPGLTSGLAALAGAGIPATLRGVSQAITLATGHAAEPPVPGEGPDWAALAKTGQPIVIYMGLGNLPLIRDQLLAGGLAPHTPAAVIHAASTPEERVLVSDLAGVAEAARRENIKSPALIVIGEIVAWRHGAAPAGGAS
ncbi:uroporphyrinogen-III C-methyltransferase [Camelimonas sp. ID_303_24]